MTQRLGIQASTTIQYVMFTIAVIVMTFGVLNTLGVSPTELLAGAGIVSVTAGLVISTFVGGLLSGLLVFTAHRFKAGNVVLVNNIPGKVVELSALVMRIQTDVGQITLQNSAIASGGVILTVVRKQRQFRESRLHYAVGDRVVTPYLNEQGTIKEITSFTTTIRLDSQKEVTFQNNSILSGAKLSQKLPEKQHKRILNLRNFSLFQLLRKFGLNNGTMLFLVFSFKNPWVLLFRLSLWTLTSSNLTVNSLI